MKRLLIFSILLLSCVYAQEKQPTFPKDAIWGESARTLVVQPVILCDDNGKTPARHAIPQNLIHQAYSRAKLNFLYLTTTRWNYGKGLRGEVNLDTIVAKGRKLGIISTDPSVLTLLFVTAVDGHHGPLGRGMQNGNVCFVCLGPKGTMTSPAEQAFVVAHEVGHCLGLRHAVDDPAVPNDMPNLQGDGDFEKRIAPEGLHPSQVTTVRNSRLSQPQIRFLTRKEAGDALNNDHWKNNPQSLTDNGLRFQLGLSIDAPIPTAPEKRKPFIRQHFNQVAEDFTPEEIKSLTQLTDELEKRLARSPFFGGAQGLISRLPWNFIKVKPNFCKGYPHTRGLHIVLTAPAITRFSQLKSEGMMILLHEKIHIAQRLSPGVFAATYRRYGFSPAQLAPNEASRLQILANPDAREPYWAIKSDGNNYLLATSLKSIDPTDPSDNASTASFVFNLQCYPLKMTARGNIAQAPLAEFPPGILSWIKTLPVQQGFDDPREVQAYQIGELFQSDILKKPTPLTPEQQKTLEAERTHLPKLLQPKPLSP